MKKSKQNKTKKTKLYVCKICNKTSKKSILCCGSKMTSQEKGSWNI
ncbi:MAG: hypothetical protein QXZ20_04245 [Candidatus Aenigmatarchaeota archaeon]